MRMLMMLSLLSIAPSFSVQAQGTNALTQLSQARERWQTSAISSYTYGYNKYCDCHGDTPPETLVTVTAGKVTDVRHRLVNSDRIVPAAERNFSLYWTVQELFELIDSAIQRDAVVRVRYDATLGYPTSFFIDYVADLIGDEVDIRVIRFERA